MGIEKMEVISSEDGKVHVGLHYIRSEDADRVNAVITRDIELRYRKEVKLYFHFVTDQYKAFGIQFSKAYLQRWNDIPLLNLFLSNETNHENTDALDSTWSTTPNMRAIIHDILFCAHTGPLRKMYLEAKILELLCIALHLWKDRQQVNDIPAQPDVRKIQVVHNHILQNIANPGTISDLARLAGINEHKLKKGFRQLYGNSILAFIIDWRLQQARSLLLQSDHSIKSIAIMMGYRDRSNFTAAFRKKFGYAPCILRS